MSDALTLTQNILDVTLANLPPDSTTPPIGPLPGPFAATVADVGATTISPEMITQYDAILALASYVYRI